MKGKHTESDTIEGDDRIEDPYKSRIRLSGTRYADDIREAATNVLGAGTLSYMAVDAPVVLFMKPENIYDLLPQGVKDRVSKDDIAVILFTGYQANVECHVHREIDEKSKKFLRALDAFRDGDDFSR